MVDKLQLTTADLAALRSAVGRRTPAADDRERIERIRLLEELKGSVAAAQAAETAAFVASQRALSEQRDPDRPAQGLPAEIGLARRISPHAAARYLHFACLLSSELPGTFAALAEGRTSEWRALLVARETAWLSPADRASVD